MALVGCWLVLALAAYVDRVYSEMGKFLAREYQDNIDAWTRAVEPRLRLGRESIALSASVLRQLTLATIALIAGLRLYVPVEEQPQLARVPTFERDCVHRLSAGTADSFLRSAAAAVAVCAHQGSVDRAYSAAAGGAVLPDSAGDADAGVAAVNCGAGGAGRRRGGRASVRGDGRAAGGWRGRGNSGGERPRTGAVGGGVWRQGGARGDDAAAGDLCRAGDADPGGVPGAS